MVLTITDTSKFREALGRSGHVRPGTGSANATGVNDTWVPHAGAAACERDLDG
jgi:hypothetical protein